MKCPSCGRSCTGDVTKYHDKYIENFFCTCGWIWSREFTAEDMKILHELRKIK